MNFNIRHVYFYLMPKLSIEYIIHFIIHASFSHSSIEFNLEIVNLVPYQKNLDTEPINCVGVHIFEHSELKFTNA